MAASLSNEGKVEFQGTYGKAIRDPENPTVVVDAGASPSTNGDLRIEYVPAINFWRSEISTKDTISYANAQLFYHGSAGPRGNFVQISDYRGTAGGWLLQLKQEKQFYNTQAKNKELTGTVISFDQSWANSTRAASQAPIVSKDVIRIDNIGESYNLAQASQGTGEGTWSIIFGGSIENKAGKADTLSPRLDTQLNPVSDPLVENQPIYQNSAISLSIPGKSAIDPVPYKTVLTWMLSELP